MTPMEGMPLTDFRKLDIRDGAIHYKLYAQDGTFIPMSCRDTLSNRLFVSWVQKFDRYTAAGEEIFPSPHPPNLRCGDRSEGVGK